VVTLHKFSNKSLDTRFPLNDRSGINKPDQKSSEKFKRYFNKINSDKAVYWEKLNIFVMVLK